MSESTMKLRGEVAALRMTLALTLRALKQVDDSIPDRVLKGVADILDGDRTHPFNHGVASSLERLTKEVNSVS